MTDKDLTGRTLERRVTDAYRAMGAIKVEHDILLAGNQIDVYVELPAPGHTTVRIAVEVKDYKKPVGVAIVNDFAKIVDLLYSRRLIHEGVLVGASGFSRPARDAAQTHDLRLLEPADLEAMTGQAIPAPAPVATVTSQPQPTPPPATASTNFTGPHIDPDNPPYARLRKLLKKAFDAKSLQRIDHEPVFAEMRHRFAPGDNVDDLIDELFEFCRTGMLWDELVAFVAESKPGIYNHFAAQWGWPQAADPPQTSERSEQEILQPALDAARSTLAVLEKQAGAYTELTIPAHLQYELDAQRRKVADLEARLQQ